MSYIPPVPLSLVVPTTASTTTYGVAVHTPLFERLVLVAALASLSASTLDVYVQESWDNGTTWTDVGHFAQITAGHAAVIYRLVLPSAGTAVVVGQGTVSNAPPVLAAGSFADGPWGPMLRLVSVTGIGANASTATQTLTLLSWRPGQRAFN